MLYVSHGVREHMGRYELLGECLAENGVITFGHDHGTEYKLFLGYG